MKKKKVVAIGGGSGLFVLLQGLKKLPVEITAVVSIADSGGSSGRLRDEFGILPPGDIRRALLALSSLPLDQITLRQLFEYRFNNGVGLKGHSFGNLLLTALNEILRDEVKAISVAGKMLEIKGRVFPVSLDKTHLCARLEDGTIIKGEANIDIRRVRPELRILDVFLDPPAKVFSGARKAILESEIIFLGPGDLYTSLIPNLLVEGVNQAISRSRALVVYVCNLMTKKGETDGFKAEDFIKEVEFYLGEAKEKLALVLINSQWKIPAGLKKKYQQEGASPVVFDRSRWRRKRPRLVLADLASAGQLWRHDPEKLADLIKRELF